MTIKEFIEADPAAADFRELLLLAIASDGKHAGNIRETAPERDTKAFGVWQCFVSSLAPARMDVGGLLGNRVAQDAFTSVDPWVRARLAVINALEEPCRFNLWATRHDRDEALATIKAYVDKHTAA